MNKHKVVFTFCRADFEVNTRLLEHILTDNGFNYASFARAVGITRFTVCNVVNGKFKSRPIVLTILLLGFIRETNTDAFCIKAREIKEKTVDCNHDEIIAQEYPDFKIFLEKNQKKLTSAEIMYQYPWSKQW